MRKSVLSAALVLALSGCATTGEPGIGPRGIGGSMLGGAAGGLLAAVVTRGNPVAIASGVLIGAGAGYVTGDVLDRQAQAARQQALRQAYATAQPQVWQSGQVAGRVEPGALVLRQGRQCRRATVTTIVEGKVHAAEVCVRPGPGVGELVVEAWDGQ